MEINVDAPLPFPRARVFAMYRDHLVELAEHLPNIRGIKVVRRDERPGEVHLVNEWIGGGDIPSVARSVLRESMLKWTDFATWKEESYTCAWRTEVHAFPGVVVSSGKNSFIESMGATRIEFRGTLVCDASKVPGVPKLVARTLNGTLEKLFVGKVAENLVAVAKAVGKLLEQEGR